MPDFTYIARNPNGDKVTGTIAASSSREAVATLSAQELFPLKVETDTPVSTRRAPRVRAQLVATTYGQLAALLRSGVPLLRSIDVVRHPLERVFQTFRDRMPEIAEYIPNVSRIDVTERTDHPDGRVSLVNQWHAVSDIPTAAKAVVKPEMLGWTDRAEWHPEQRVVHWQLEPMFFTDKVKCSGTNRFTALDDQRTEVRLEGDLQIHLGDLAFVPRPFRARVSKELERFIVSLIGPNLGNATKAVERFLDDQD